MKCTHCQEPLLSSKATAGSPPKEYWVTLDNGGLVFHCKANSYGPHETASDWLENISAISRQRLADQDVTTSDLVNVKTSVLCEVARELESLRLTNPMNGDGSNYMLDKALRKVFALDGTGMSIHAAEDEHARMQAKLDADYRRLEDENAARRNAAAERQDNQGLNQPAG